MSTNLYSPWLLIFSTYMHRTSSSLILTVCVVPGGLLSSDCLYSYFFPSYPFLAVVFTVLLPDTVSCQMYSYWYITPSLFFIGTSSISWTITSLIFPSSSFSFCSPFLLMSSNTFPEILLSASFLKLITIPFAVSVSSSHLSVALFSPKKVFPGAESASTNLPAVVYSIISALFVYLLVSLGSLTNVPLSFFLTLNVNVISGLSFTGTGISSISSSLFSVLLSVTFPSLLTNSYPSS